MKTARTIRREIKESGQIVIKIECPYCGKYHKHGLGNIRNPHQVEEKLGDCGNIYKN